MSIKYKIKWTNILYIVMFSLQKSKGEVIISICGFRPQMEIITSLQ